MRPGREASGGARATANARIHAPGFDVTGQVDLRLTLDSGLSLDSFKLRLGSDIPIKGLVVKEATLAYSHESGADVWEGGVEVGLPARGPIVGGSLKLVNGSLTARLGTPFVLEAGGTLHLTDQEVSSAWLRASIPGGVAFKGSISRSFLIVHLEGGVGGSIDSHSFEAEGSVKVSASPVSAKGDALLNNAGIAGCASARVLGKSVSIGGAHRWSGGDSVFKDSCGFGRLRSALGAGSSAVTSAAGGFRIPAHARQVNLVVHGGDGPPEIVLDHGKRRKLVEPGSTGTFGRAVYVAFADEAHGDTYIALAQPPAGRLRVAAPSGQPRLARVGAALPLPNPRVRTKVRKVGPRRLRLSWHARHIGGQRLVFQDTDVRGRNQVLSTARARGSITFRAHDDGARGAHRLRVVVLQDGLIREALSGPRYKPAPVRIARPRVRVRLRRGHAVITWHRVAYAASYEVFVTTSDGRRLFFSRPAKKRGVRIPTAGRVNAAVRGVGAGLEHGPKGIGRARRAVTRSNHSKKHRHQRRKRRHGASGMLVGDRHGR